MIWQMERRPLAGPVAGGDRAGARPDPVWPPSAGRRAPSVARLSAAGFAAWTGDSGNYWGHNAIIRVAAFRAAAPAGASGRAPLGRSVLSHDFVEAAWIRRAGWAVALDPATAGSAEDAPQTLAAFHARDRRWCQGNLQHLRLLAEPGLTPSAGCIWPWAS
jgi:membrane glycosyltransferase